MKQFTAEDVEPAMPTADTWKDQKGVEDANTKTAGFNAWKSWEDLTLKHRAKCTEVVDDMHEIIT